MKKTKLFCIPFAGGSAMTYNKWKLHLDASIELVPLELAGRGRRTRESFYNSMEEAVEDLYKVIHSEVDHHPYALFGHSMGSAMAYELHKKLVKMGHQHPVHAFMSGRYPPHTKREEKTIHQLPDKEFKDEIMKVGGTAAEIFENRELMSIFLPILRADYRILETYCFQKEKVLFNCDLTVLNGNSDTLVSPYEMLAWDQYTTKQMHLKSFIGGHFFINDYTKEIVHIINQTLKA